MNDRTCIVTRKSASIEKLIRFVISPDNKIIPDIKANLPGRGMWVSAHRDVLEKAIKSQAFRKNVRADVEVTPDLANIVDKLLLDSVLGSLSIARKAGAIVAGLTKVDEGIRSGRVILVLHAKEAKEDGKRKIAQAIHAIQKTIDRDIKTVSLFTNDEMGIVFGANPAIHAALLNTRAAHACLKKIHKLIAYRGNACHQFGEITENAVKEI